MFKTCLFKMLLLPLCLLFLVLFSGCSGVDKRMPSEDIEVPVKYSDIITILKNPSISSNSKEKYNAVCDLLKVVDLSFTREVKTINDIFYHGDAAIRHMGNGLRVVVFNFQDKNRYVRLTFKTMREFVLSTTIETRE